MKGEDVANSLRAKLSKLRHDGHITDAEYQAFIKKLDGHDREIRNKAIDDFCEKFCDACCEQSMEVVLENGIKADILTIDGATELAFEIAEEMRGGERNG